MIVIRSFLKYTGRKEDEMKIIIDDRYFIETDKYNYILREKYISQKKKSYGKEVVNTIGYYNNLESLAERYMEEYQKAVGDQSKVDLDGYVKLINESNKMAVSALYDILKAYAIKG